jgi:MinD superfamily P-loop ATPase
MSEVIKPQLINSQVITPKRRRRIDEIPFPKIDPEFCIDCGECRAICPSHALVSIDDEVFIDETKCSKCRLCAAVCPVEAIH